MINTEERRELVKFGKLTNFKVKRFAELQSSQIVYFSNNKTKKIKGKIDILDSTIELS